MTAPEPGTPPAAPEAGVSRRIQLLAAVIFAALVVVVFIVVLTGGSDSRRGVGADPGGEVLGVAETTALLKGVPQDGLLLGQADAPVTIVEFLDLQCPFCAAYENTEQPQVIDAVVRTGQAKIQLVPLAILGDDSDRARNVVLRLAQRDLAWNFVNLVFLNQGAEGTGYMTPDYFTSILTKIPGASSADASSSPLDATLAKQKLAAQDLGKAVLSHPGDGTPYFVVGPTGGDPRSFAKVDTASTKSAADAVIAAVTKQLARPQTAP